MCENNFKTNAEKKWSADRWIAFSAMLLAIAAFILSLYNSWLNRDYLRKSTKPEMLVSFFYNDQTTYQVIKGDEEYAIRCLEGVEGLKFGYIDRFDAGLKELDEGVATFCLFRRTRTKQEVVDIVKKGETFAPKTTRHILPWAYQDIDTKYEELF